MTTRARRALSAIAVGPLAAVALLAGCSGRAGGSNDLTCADVGGVFEAHGVDGRGSSVPADRRPKCHVPPADQDPDYLADVTLTPPFPNGTLQYPIIVPTWINGASNKDCWKLPPGS